MDSIQEILGQKSFKAPDELKALSDYVKRNYKSTSRVRAEKDVVILSVPSSALAGTLQMEKQNIIKACNLKKRLVIRIGR